MAKSKMVGKYFSRIECACKCGCGQDDVDPDLIKMADELREYLGKPMITTSVNRCEKHNSNVGGVKGSQHVQGKAMDFYIRGLPTKKLINICKKLWKEKKILKGGLGVYPKMGFVHIDSGRRRTWKGK